MPCWKPVGSFINCQHLLSEDGTEQDFSTGYFGLSEYTHLSNIYYVPETIRKDGLC